MSSEENMLVPEKDEVTITMQKRIQQNVVKA